MQDKARAKSHHGAMDAMLRTPNIVAGIPAADLPGWQRKLSQQPTPTLRKGEIP
jgi:hypothetical protein